MKELKTLEAIKGLINCNDVEFIPVEKANMIYIDYGSSQHNLISAYDTSKKIAQLFDTNIVFRFNGCDIFVHSTTKEEDVCKQYKSQHDINYECYVVDIFTKASKNLNVNNIKKKISQAQQCIENKNGFRAYIPDYQMNQLSKEIINLYKSAISDSYLDGMVEKAKVLKKQKYSIKKRGIYEAIKKQNWWLYLLLQICTFGLFTFVMAHHLKVYDEDAWYQNWRYWFFSGLCFVFPIFIVALVFAVQITCEVAAKLNVPGKEIYNTPYSWILCIIVPVVGWVLLIVMFIYIIIWTIAMLAKGNGEKYIEE